MDMCVDMCVNMCVRRGAVHMLNKQGGGKSPFAVEYFFGLPMGVNIRMRIDMCVEICVGICVETDA